MNAAELISSMLHGGRAKDADSQPNVHDKDGYRLVRAPSHPRAQNGYVRQQVLVMERWLGRYLHPNEVIYHVNGIRNDNRIENLLLFESPSALASHSLIGNTRSSGDFGNPKRRIRVKRNRAQMLKEVRKLADSLGREIRRSDLKPPYPSHRTLTRAFGSWRLAVFYATADTLDFLWLRPSREMIE